MEREAKINGIEIIATRCDNGIFKSTEFRVERKEVDQVITYYDVNAHH